MSKTNKSITIDSALWDDIDETAKVQLGTDRGRSRMIEITMAVAMGRDKYSRLIPPGFGYERVAIKKEEEDND